jgi:hypothetical protein
MMRRKASEDKRITKANLILHDLIKADEGEKDPCSPTARHFTKASENSGFWEM